MKTEHGISVDPAPGIHPDLVASVLLAILDDDHGVDEDAYNKIMLLLGIDPKVDAVLERIESAAVGRYYIRE